MAIKTDLCYRNISISRRCPLQPGVENDPVSSSNTNVKPAKTPFKKDVCHAPVNASLYIMFIFSFQKRSTTQPSYWIILTNLIVSNSERFGPTFQ